ncbi:hypothetical protein FQN57_003530 [Myotisia sp. PD_48]|nr:hypothetical protein FQN57_003530 [Myotisia sp. PD_48]
MGDFTDKLKPSQPDGAYSLAKERAGSAVDVDELANHLFAHDGFLERQARILQLIENDPLFSKATQQNLSRPDRYKLALGRSKVLRRLSDKHGWDYEDMEVAKYLMDDVNPYNLTMEMFITTIREQADEAQKAYWMPLAESWKIIGAYAQTEMGHGSNVRGIELEAKWDPDTKEFILHSPYLTASKWWNGTLGRTANHAIVVAQLYLPRPGSKTDYVSYGPHPFIVQIRDMKTHQPLEGIVIGDIGPKYGYNTMDNGYMLFDKFRIPHAALLNRYSGVDPNTGAYRKPEKAEIVYGSLTYVRARLVKEARLALARAVTVAVRYASVRRQFRDRDGDNTGAELQVLDYPTLQIRILPLLAATFALHYSGKAMTEVYWKARSNIEAGDFSDLADLHSMSSGLKSLCTMIASDGIETCRRSMGGHGFGGASGLIQLNNDYLAKPTVEGDNWMITQQVASYLIKKMTAAVKSPNAKSVDSTDKIFRDYLVVKGSLGNGGQMDIFGSDSAIVDAYQRRAAALSYKVYEARIVQKKPWTSLMIQLHRLSQAQSQLILVTNFFNGISSASGMSETTRAVMWDLYRLYAWETMENNSRDFFSAGATSNAQLDALPDKILEVMSRIRPHAVKLVDSWKIPDFLLDSALGRYDGKVYEDLYNRAHRLNPLNKITVNPNYWEDEIEKGSGKGAEGLLAKL